MAAISDAAQTVRLVFLSTQLCDRAGAEVAQLPVRVEAEQKRPRTR
jgi:hypothetical protein